MNKNRIYLAIIALLAVLMACGSDGESTPSAVPPTANSTNEISQVDPIAESESEEIDPVENAPTAETEDEMVDPTDEPEVATEVIEPTDEPVVEPTEKSEPTDEPEPTNTKVVPTEPAPTKVVATAVPVDSNRVRLIQPSDFVDQSRSMLTGEVTSAENLNRRPILCKVSNSPAQWVRPQSGLSQADMVFEHYAEGVATRFSALFHTQTPDRVGPIRSARLVDLELPVMYDSALCYSGGSSGQGQFEGVFNKLLKSTFAERVLPTTWAGYYRTGEDKPYEHTFYNRIAQAWDAFEGTAIDAKPEYVTNNQFDTTSPENGGAAKNITISYGNGIGTFVEWSYDDASGKYLRWADGDKFIDANTGLQVTAENVVVVYAPHFINENICETQVESGCIAFSTEIQLWGGNFARIFRDGKQYVGNWQRRLPSNPSAVDRTTDGLMLEFKDDKGVPIPLQIGNTWVQLVPLGTEGYLDTPVQFK